MSSLPPGGRVCARSGLVLVPAGGEVGWRTAKTSYGPLSPPPRPSDPTVDVSAWGRFDVHGGQTLYAAAERRCALAETLAYFRRRLGTADPLAADARALGLPLAELRSLVEQEWEDRGHMNPGHLARGWRVERAVYRLRLPSAGWWVLLEHPVSIAAVERGLETTLAALGVSALDVPVLRGAHRSATTAIAEWVRSRQLDDGSIPLGLQYQSRLATGACWAAWLPASGTGPLSADGVEELTDTDPDLLAVAELFDLHVW